METIGSAAKEDGAGLEPLAAFLSDRCQKLGIDPQVSCEVREVGGAQRSVLLVRDPGKGASSARSYVFYRGKDSIMAAMGRNEAADPPQPARFAKLDDPEGVRRIIAGTLQLPLRKQAEAKYGDLRGLEMGGMSQGALLDEAASRIGRDYPDLPVSVSHGITDYKDVAEPSKMVLSPDDRYAGTALYVGNSFVLASGQGCWYTGKGSGLRLTHGGVDAVCTVIGEAIAARAVEEYEASKKTQSLSLPPGIEQPAAERAQSVATI